MGATDVRHASMILQARETERHRISLLSSRPSSSQSLTSRTGGYAKLSLSSQKSDCYPQYSSLDPSDTQAIQKAAGYYSVKKSMAGGEHNRYSDIFAYDRTALRLPRFVINTDGKEAGETHDVYLNANVVVDGKGSWWVASQAPLPGSFNPFFLSFLLRTATSQYHKDHPNPTTTSSAQPQSLSANGHPLSSTSKKAAIIVQLTGLVEKGVLKADAYLPRKVGSTETYPPSKVLGAHHPTLCLTLKSSTPLLELSTTHSICTLSSLPQSITSPLPIEHERALKESMEIHHFSYSGWPDWGVPSKEDTPGLVKLVKEVGKEQKRLDCEVWVHCSAGVGRTGTFIALSSLLLEPQSNHPQPLPRDPLGPLPKAFENDKVAHLIDMLRDQRGKMAGASAQVEYLYQVARDYLSKGGKNGDRAGEGGTLRLRGGSGPTQPERKMRAVGAPSRKTPKKAVPAPVATSSKVPPVRPAATQQNVKKNVVVVPPIDVDVSDEDEDEDMEEVPIATKTNGIGTAMGETDEDDLMTDATTASAPKTPARRTSTAPSTPGNLASPTGVPEPDEEGEDDFDAEAAYGYDFHAEEVERQARTEEGSAVDGQGIVVSLGVDAQGRTPEERRRAELLANRKKPPTARDRALRLQAHKLHVVALLANAAVRNRWATDELLRSRLLSLTPHELHTAFHIPPSRYPDPVHRSRMFQAALQEVATWWANEFFEVSDPTIGVRTRSWDDVMEIVDELPRLRNKKMEDLIIISDGEVEYIGSSTGPGTADGSQSKSAKSKGKQRAKAEDRDDSDVERFLAKLGDGGERIRTVKSMMKKALQGAGGRDTSAQLFVSLCRAMGLGARLVVSLQPLQWKSDKAPPAKANKKVAPPPPPVDPKQVMLNEALAKVATSYGRKRGRNRGKVAEKTQSEEEEEDEMEEVEIPRPGPTPAKARVAQLARNGGPSTTASDADGESDTPHVNPRLNPRTANMEERYKLRKARPVNKLGDATTPKKKRKDESLAGLPPVFWAEVYCRPDQKWIPVDPVRGVIKRKKDFEPSADNGPVRMTYVVALEEDGYARDVTVRYASNYGAKTVKLRVPSNKKDADWWDGVIGMLKRPYRLNRDDLEDAELETSQISEGMPMVLAGFKDHPIYVLERHLKREEVIQPKREVGRFRGEAVFRRANVVSCKTPENWMRIGRKIKPKEEALKWVKQRAVTIDKRRAAALAEEEGQEAIQQGLYAEFQTELYRPPPIKDGIIPKNAFGNVDLYVPTMLPEGAAHLPYKGIAKVAKQLKINFAEACTGFEFKKQRAIPVITGVVVPIEDEEALMEAYRESAAAAEERALSKKEESALKRWKKLVRSIEIKARLEEQYGAGSKASSTTATPQQPPRKKIRPSGYAKVPVGPIPVPPASIPASNPASARGVKLEPEREISEGVVAKDFAAAPAPARSDGAELHGGGTGTANGSGDDDGNAFASGSGLNKQGAEHESGGFVLDEVDEGAGAERDEEEDLMEEEDMESVERVPRIQVPAHDSASPDGGENGGVEKADEANEDQKDQATDLASGPVEKATRIRTAGTRVPTPPPQQTKIKLKLKFKSQPQPQSTPAPVLTRPTRSTRTKTPTSSTPTSRASRSAAVAVPAVGARRSTRAAASRGREAMKVQVRAEEESGDEEEEDDEEEDEEMEEI